MYTRLLSILKPLIGLYIPLQKMKMSAKYDFSPQDLIKNRKEAWKKYKLQCNQFGRLSNEALEAVII